MKNIEIIPLLRSMRVKAVIGATCLLALATSAVPAFASSQDDIEAAYVFNFAKLVQWPSGSGPIVIGIVGTSSAGDAITAIVNGKSANGRTITVKTISASDAKSCQIVFVCGSGSVPSTGGEAVLTIGEGSGFAAGGGCMDFSVEGGAVRFEINPNAIKHAHLTADSKLSELGKVVG